MQAQHINAIIIATIISLATLIAHLLFGITVMTVLTVFIASAISLILYNPKAIKRTRKSSSKKRKLAPNFIQFFSSPILMLDAQGRIINTNPAADELFNYPEVGQHFSIRFRAPIFIDTVTRALRGAETAPFTFTTTRGQELHLEVRLTKLGEELGAHLMMEIYDRTEERRNDTMRRDFIANASHELRTPLSTIIGGLETIAAHPENATAAERFIPKMQTQAGRMKRLIEDLMSLSQIENNEHIHPDTRIDLAVIVREVVALYDAARIVPSRDWDQGSAWILGDHGQLVQSLTNLIDNALKYGGEGIITIGKIAETTGSQNKIGISVTDMGAGIPAADIPRITERFYRVAESSAKRDGTGLGLAIVKHITRRHGGELRINSRISMGTTIAMVFNLSNETMNL